MKQLSMEAKDYKVLSHSLPNIEFFSSLSVSEIERMVRSIQMYSFEAGEYVFKQGSNGDAFFIIYEGAVAVCVKKYFFLPEKVKVTLRAGQFFGEMALLDRRPHSSSIRAVTPIRLFVLLLSAFDLLCEENPSFKNEIKIIAERRKFQNLHGC